MSQGKQHPKFAQGELVYLKDTSAARKYGAPGKIGEVLDAAVGSAWVIFRTARGGRDEWIPDEHLERIY